MDWLSFILGTLFGGIGCVVAIAAICCAAYWWAQREGAKAREAMRFDMPRRATQAAPQQEPGFTEFQRLLETEQAKQPPYVADNI